MNPPNAALTAATGPGADEPHPALTEDRASAPDVLRFAVAPHAERILVAREDHEGVFAGFEPERDWEVLAWLIEDLVCDLVTPGEVSAVCEDDGARLAVYLRGAHGRILRLASEHTAWPKSGDRALCGTAFGVSVAHECAQIANSTLTDLTLTTGYTAPAPPGLPRAEAPQALSARPSPRRPGRAAGRTPGHPTPAGTATHPLAAPAPRVVGPAQRCGVRSRPRGQPARGPSRGVGTTVVRRAHTPRGL